MKVFLLFFTVFLLLPLNLTALNPEFAAHQYMKDSWTVTDGLPINSVQNITQTDDGYLWLGTEEGLVKFDGADFSVYDYGNVEGMGSNFVTFAYGFEKGRIIAGLFGGAGVMEYDYYSDRKIFVQGFRNRSVNSFAPGDGNYFWIGVAGKDSGLYKLQKSDGNYVVSKELPNLSVSIVSKGLGRSLWIVYDGRNIMLYSSGNVVTSKEFSEPIISFYVDSQGKAWIGTSGNGLFSYDKDGDVFHSVGGKNLAGSRVDSISEDSDGNLWVGTYNRGLFRIRNMGKAEVEERDIVDINNVQAIFEDREGSLWLGTVTSGLLRLKEGKFRVFSEKDGLSDKEVISLESDGDGGILIGTFSGGLNRLDRKSGRITPLHYPGYLEKNASVLTVLKGQDKTLWAAHSGKHLAEISDSHKRKYATAGTPLFPERENTFPSL